MGEFTKVNGKTIRSMAKELNYSQTVGHILVDFMRINDQEKDNSNGYEWMRLKFKDLQIDKLKKKWF